MSIPGRWSYAAAPVRWADTGGRGSRRFHATRGIRALGRGYAQYPRQIASDRTLLRGHHMVGTTIGPSTSSSLDRVLCPSLYPSPFQGVFSLCALIRLPWPQYLTLLYGLQTLITTVRYTVSADCFNCYILFAYLLALLFLCYKPFANAPLNCAFVFRYVYPHTTENRLPPPRFPISKEITLFSLYASVPLPFSCLTTRAMPSPMPRTPLSPHSSSLSFNFL